MSKQLNFTFNVSVGPQIANDNSDYLYLVEGIAAYTPDNSKWTFAADFPLLPMRTTPATNGDTGYLVRHHRLCRVHPEQVHHPQRPPRMVP